MATKIVKIASSIRKTIHSGALQVGDKLSSIRQIAEINSVSVPTVVSALRQLEDEGIIEARSRSGFFVRNQQTKSIPKSTALDLIGVTANVRRLFSGGTEGMVALGAALPSTSWLPLDELKTTLNSTVRRIGSNAQQYSLPPGRFELRRRISLLCAKRGTQFGPDDVTITQGATEALDLALTATCQKGDIVLVESPAYFGHLCLLEKLGLRALEVTTDPVTGLDIGAVKYLLEKHEVAVILCTSTVQNPLGATMPNLNKKKLVELCSEFEVPIIEDDVYGLLQDGDVTSPPLKAFDAKGLVLYCSSFSKCLVPGWRIGFIVAGKYQTQIVDMRFCSHLSGSPLMEAALSSFLADSAFSRHINRFKRRAVNSRASFTLEIKKSFPPEIKVSQPSGGYLLWLTLPDGVKATEIAELAKLKGITVSPGPLFSARGAFNNCLRINAGQDLTDQIKNAIKLLGEATFKLT